MFDRENVFILIAWKLFFVNKQKAQNQRQWRASAPPPSARRPCCWTFPQQSAILLQNKPLVKTLSSANDMKLIYFS